MKQCFLDCAQAKVASLQDLLNTPLPKFLPGILVSSPPYAADFKGKLYAMLINLKQHMFLLHYLGLSSSPFLISYINSSSCGEESPFFQLLFCGTCFESEG